MATWSYRKTGSAFDVSKMKSLIFSLTGALLGPLMLEVVPSLEMASLSQSSLARSPRRLAWTESISLPCSLKNFRNLSVVFWSFLKK